MIRGYNRSIIREFKLKKYGFVIKPARIDFEKRKYDYEVVNNSSNLIRMNEFCENKTFVSAKGTF